MDKATEKKELDKLKRQQARLRKMLAGMDELSLWLHDLLRSGLLTLPDKPRHYFEEMDKRLIDAQCPGLATLLRNLRDLDYKSSEQWQDYALQAIGKMWVIIRGFQALDRLEAPLQAEIKALAGWGVGPKDVMADPEALAIQDHWLVAARTTELQDDITTQSNWLLGLHTGCFALVLNFAFKKMPIETSLVPGQVFEGELAYFPAASPMRAVVRTQGVTIKPEHSLNALVSWGAVETYIAGQLSQNPLVEQFPVFVQGLVPLYNQGVPVLVDCNKVIVEIEPLADPVPFLKLMSISGGHPLDLFILAGKNGAAVMGCFHDGHYMLILST